MAFKCYLQLRVLSTNHHQMCKEKRWLTLWDGGQSAASFSCSGVTLHNEPRLTENWCLTIIANTSGKFCDMGTLMHTLNVWFTRFAWFIFHIVRMCGTSPISRVDIGLEGLDDWLPRNNRLNPRGWHVGSCWGKISPMRAGRRSEGWVEFHPIILLNAYLYKLQRK